VKLGIEDLTKMTLRTSELRENGCSVSCNFVPERSAQKQQHHSAVSHFSCRFVVKYDFRGTNHYVTIKSQGIVYRIYYNRVVAQVLCIFHITLMT
jgi:hypothetical protein